MDCTCWVSRNTCLYEGHQREDIVKKKTPAEKTAKIDEKKKLRKLRRRGK
jgi:hypothetical protein